MLGRMMDEQLLCSRPIRYAARYYGDEEVVVRAIEGGIHRTTYAQIHARACRLSDAMARCFGIGRGDVVATLAFNTDRHLELFHAVPGMGAVLHTVNPRLFGDQIVSVIERGGANLIFVDLACWDILAPLLERLLPLCRIVVMTDRANMPEVAGDAACYEELLEQGREEDRWPDMDERSAATLCFTSGTTGEPKGVLYSHRSIFLTCMRSLMGDQIGPAAYFGDTILATPPFYHTNGWNLPWIAPMAGSKLVLPGRNYEAEALAELMDAEGVTATAAVPTVWTSLVRLWRDRGAGPRTLKRVNIGGSSPGEEMLRMIEQEYGVEVFQGWGMTETSALGNSARAKPRHLQADWNERVGYKMRQGRVGFGVDARIVAEDGSVLPHDDQAAGELQVRGPWIAASYLGDVPATTNDGWLRTGDIVRIDPDGYLQLVDRDKDVIKSGGEWISSQDIERIAKMFPCVDDAAVIGAPHPQWTERPILLIVSRDGFDASALLEHIAGHVAKWWVPDDVVAVDGLPVSGTGKIDKVTLRKRFAAHFDTAEAGVSTSGKSHAL